MPRKRALAGLPPRPYAGCEHVPAGELGPVDWRYLLKRSCECCGRGAVARHATKRSRVRCEDCGGVMRPRGVLAGQERWVIEIDLEVPADVAHEQQAVELSEKLLDHLAEDPTLANWVG